MPYHFSKLVDRSFELAVATTVEVLRRHGFGVLTDIDVQATMNKKLGVDFRPSRILGICNPQMAYKAVQAEDKIGTMLPCNVVVQQQLTVRCRCQRSIQWRRCRLSPIRPWQKLPKTSGLC